MNKEETKEELSLKFAEFAIEYPQSALALITGLFVGLLEHSVKEQGCDENQEIRVESCLGGRDIIVSAVHKDS